VMLHELEHPCPPTNNIQKRPECLLLTQAETIQLTGSADECEIALYQCALINCTPLKPLPLNQPSQKAINAKPRPSPAAAAKA